jgi:hypothetical protein
VQLDVHFVEAGKIGELLVSRPHVVRLTRSLIFITTEVTVDKRCRDGERRVQDLEERELGKRRHSGARSRTRKFEIPRCAIAHLRSGPSDHPGMTDQLRRTHPMHYRNLGRSGLKISPICLGTMMFGGPTDEASSQRIASKAREAGVNFIDTADAYNVGNSEKVVGRATRMSGWILSTKLANPIGDRTTAGCRGAGLQAEDSLKRLGTDFIDIYYAREDHATPLQRRCARSAT